MQNNQANMSVGVVFALMATLLWGSYPLWYSPLKGIDSVDVLAVRVVGSLLFVLILLGMAKNASFSDVKALLKDNRARLVLASSAAISGIWWLTYIIGVTNNMVLEASLGYYISPIFSVMFGFLVFKERPSMVQWFAIILTATAILNLIAGYGQTPWIALIIGMCFSLYAAIRKGVAIKPLPGLTIECVFLFPFAIGYFIFLAFQGGPSFGAETTTTQWAVLAVVGLISVLPLWWYTVAAQNLEMITLAFFQLIPPTCNFIFAVFLFGEEFTEHHQVTFALVFLASLIYLLDQAKVFSRKTLAAGEQ
ncbi:MAG TPA: EamA family transporter RarD [Marinobacter sp.]|uniref:EamA family transporter RarD n=1 Tax=Marinobacter sp. TaxID=50741 RepID=UPI002D80172E|nr:EamA family transporter RarD [Marinobacter sp.]HET8800348.1 EamA family transporter RarD [Marinobacter sp.]